MENILKTSLICEICQCLFTQKSSLNRHISSVHEAKKPFKCEACDYCCSGKSVLKRHVASVHEEKRTFVNKAATK